MILNNPFFDYSVINLVIVIHNKAIGNTEVRSNLKYNKGVAYFLNGILEGTKYFAIWGAQNVATLSLHRSTSYTNCWSTSPLGIKAHPSPNWDLTKCLEIVTWMPIRSVKDCGDGAAEGLLSSSSPPCRYLRLCSTNTFFFEVLYLSKSTVIRPSTEKPNGWNIETENSKSSSSHVGLFWLLLVPLFRDVID